MEEHILIDKLKRGNKNAFSLLFTAYYKDLVLFGRSFIHEREACEDIVQSVFLKLWDDRATLEISVSLKSYLLTAVRNSCLNELRRQHVVTDYASFILSRPAFENPDTENDVFFSDLHTHFTEALKKVPEANRIVFEMNRIQGLKYKEIAAKLDITERQVEQRIAQTLVLLRKYLKEFLSFLLLFS